MHAIMPARNNGITPEVTTIVYWERWKWYFTHVLALCLCTVATVSAVALAFQTTMRRRMLKIHQYLSFAIRS